MAKPSVETWDKAKALFEAGKSFRDIDKILGIPFSTIKYRADKEGWEQGKIEQLIIDKTKVSEDFAQLNSVQKEVVQKEVDDRLRHITFFNNATVKNLSVMMKKIDEDTAIAEHRLAQQAIKDGKETVLGKTPDTAIQINNNTQGGDDVAARIRARQRDRLG